MIRLPQSEFVAKVACRNRAGSVAVGEHPIEATIPRDYSLA